jgi:predicted nucleic acid-binding protein
MVWIDEAIESEAWQILEKYSALRLSLTDATSAAIAQKRRLTQFFGLDRHFEALGFTVLPG